MTDEAALKLAEAINRFSEALERMQPGSLGGGLHVYHHGGPWQQPQPVLQPAQWPTYGPAYSGGQ